MLGLKWSASFVNRKIRVINKIVLICSFVCEFLGQEKLGTIFSDTILTMPYPDFIELEILLTFQKFWAEVFMFFIFCNVPILKTAKNLKRAQTPPIKYAADLLDKNRIFPNRIFYSPRNTYFKSQKSGKNAVFYIPWEAELRLRILEQYNANYSCGSWFSNEWAFEECRDLQKICGSRTRPCATYSTANKKWKWRIFELHRISHFIVFLMLSSHFQT